MKMTPAILPELVQAVNDTVIQHADELTELDKAIGDGDHVINLQRGLDALLAQRAELAQLDWPGAWQKMGMTCMSKIGGASGSLLGTFFVAMAKSAKGESVDTKVFALAFAAGVQSMKLRGKADAGEKTMLDVLIPVASVLQTQAENTELSLSELLAQVKEAALLGVESTRDMLATKGRASFLGERSLGHIDAGAKSSQLMVCAVADVLQSR